MCKELAIDGHDNGECALTCNLTLLYTKEREFKKTTKLFPSCSFKLTMQFRIFFIISPKWQSFVSVTSLHHKEDIQYAYRMGQTGAQTHF